MPRGVPRLGQSVVDDLSNAPQAEVLGEWKAKGPELPVWDDPELKAQIALEEGPPPWEKFGEDSSNARQFLSCPTEWVLYWINPKMLDQSGWRGWQPVRVKDPRVKLKIPSMASPEGQIRRGGPTGDILGYMPRHWYEERRREYAELNRRQTQASVDRMNQLREEISRGTIGGGMITLESAKHPTHTMANIVNPTD